MLKPVNVSIHDMVFCLSDTLELISPSLMNHHRRVSLIAASIAKKLNLTLNEQIDLKYAGALHDLGAIFFDVKLDTLKFDTFSKRNILHKHSQQGYYLLHKFPPFESIAEIIRFHHIPWDYGRGKVYKNKNVPFLSNILCLSDAVDLLLSRKENVLDQVKYIRKEIEKNSDIIFHPDAVSAFLDLAKREYFWFDVAFAKNRDVFDNHDENCLIQLNQNELLGLARIFGQIIDFRSPFTATHSSGVADSAEIICKLLGLSPEHSLMVKIAGHLHDLGKLAVPTKILEKNKVLNKIERNIVRVHPYLTYRILKSVSGLEHIADWAAYHHEQPNGKGYPFHLDEGMLSLESQILAVVDVFSAIMENRPYRNGMKKDRAIKILKNLVNEFVLNKEITANLTDNFDDINQIREQSQAQAHFEYKNSHIFALQIS